MAAPHSCSHTYGGIALSVQDRSALCGAVAAGAFRLGGVGQMDDNLEFRGFPVGQIQVRATDAAPTQIVGYAAVFDQLSGDLGFFCAKIA